MRRRRISEEMVREVIAQPDATLERDDGCVEYVALLQDELRDRRIEVVVDEARRSRRVVTVYELEDEWR